MRCVDLFKTIYKKEPDGVSFCSYRVCPLGAHVDHQLGKVSGFAIDKGIHFAYSATQYGIVELTSLQFEKRAQFHIDHVPMPVHDWADYLRGATLALSKIKRLTVGISGVFDGDLPIGGLSSSASVTLAFLVALCKANDIVLTKEQLIETALNAERNYVGVNCGKLDQSCEVYSQKGHLLYLDTLDGSYELLKKRIKTKTPLNTKVVKITGASNMNVKFVNTTMLYTA